MDVSIDQQPSSLNGNAHTHQQSSSLNGINAQSIPQQPVDINSNGIDAKEQLSGLNVKTK